MTRSCAEPVTGDAHRSQRGVALLIVLWVLGLLSALAVGLAGSSRTELLIAGNLAENARARALADAGIALAIQALLGSGGDVSRADGTTYDVSWRGGELRLRLQDEGGKIDLNVAPESLIDGILDVVGVAPAERLQLVDAIADWRDGDDTRRAAGAEAADYRRASRDYGPRNGPFQSLDELRLVLGMTEALFDRLAPFVTVYSGRRQVNPDTAPREVLLALPGTDPAIVDAALGLRAMAGSAADVAAMLAPARRFLRHARPAIVTVRAAAKTSRGAGFVREAIVSLRRNPAQPYRLLAWRQPLTGEAEAR